MSEGYGGTQAPLFAPGASGTARNRICRLSECGRPLTGKQREFCSRACNSRWWDLQHPRVAVVPGGKREASLKLLILGALQDGQWHSKAELALLLHAREHSVGSRISELKRDGHPIETDAPNGCSTRAHRYRLERA